MTLGPSPPFFLPRVPICITTALDKMIWEPCSPRLYSLGSKDQRHWWIWLSGKKNDSIHQCFLCTGHYARDFTRISSHNQPKHLLSSHHFYCLRDKKTNVKKLKDWTKCSWRGVWRSRSRSRASVTHSGAVIPGLFVSLWSLMSLTVWLSFPGYLFDTVG